MRGLKTLPPVRLPNESETAIMRKLAGHDITEWTREVRFIVDEGARPPVRSRKLRVHDNRASLGGLRPATIASPPNQSERRDMTWDEVGVDARAPKKLGDCLTGPCPWVRCRHHLAIEVEEKIDKDGRTIEVLKRNHPSKEVWEMRDTCSLRVAMRAKRQNPGGTGPVMDFAAIGKKLNLTAEATRRVLLGALRKLARRAKALR